MRLRSYILVWLALCTASLSAAQSLSAADRRQLTESRTTLDKILTDNIIPFWYPAVIDKENGGYRLNHDASGKWLGQADRSLVTQARTLWFFARLYDSPYKKPEYLEAARHGYVFLRDRMYDKKYGGFFLDVRSTESVVTRDEKHLYAQSFALYALAEYAQVSRDGEARELAGKLFATLEYRAHDNKYGGYREFFKRDWTEPAADAISFMGTTPDLKLYNTHLHLLESFTTYYRLTNDPLVRQRLYELLTAASNSVVRKNVVACTDRHRRDWTPLHGPEFDVASYGHDVENVWLTMDACDAIGQPQGLLSDLYVTLFDYSLQYGFDTNRGGFYYFGPFSEPATNRGKSWWVQAEALVSSLCMYQLTGQAKYIDCFYKTLDWVVKHQVDWDNGDWHQMIAENGNISGSKAGPWKSPYHNGRAMIECIELIDALLEKPFVKDQ